MFLALSAPFKGDVRISPVFEWGQRRQRRLPKRVLSIEKGTRVSGTNDAKRDDASSAKVGRGAAAGRGAAETGTEAEPLGHPWSKLAFWPEFWACAAEAGAGSAEG